MARQLPWELEEEILSRLPPQSLVRFRSVCQRWNALFNDKAFVNNHLSRSRPRFIFMTSSRKYLMIDIIDPDSIDPTVELHELPQLSDIPFGDVHELIRYKNLVRISNFDEVLFCQYGHENRWTALWNPWLREVEWSKSNDMFWVYGLGYDNSRPEKVYKILGHLACFRTKYMGLAIYDCASHAFKFIDAPEKKWHLEFAQTSAASLNGNLYWITPSIETTTSELCIRRFDFSVDNFKPFCHLPCQKNHPRDTLVLAVFRGDRFSLLKQCYVSRNVEIWVTNKIDGKEVVWTKWMTLPTSILPTLYDKRDRISYFIYDKTLFMCCGDDETGAACIYITKRDLCKKIQIDSRDAMYNCHCVYTPNLISVPQFGR